MVHTYSWIAILSQYIQAATTKYHQLGGLPSAVVAPDGSLSKESTCNAGDPGLIPGLGRSPEEGKGYPLQYSGLENSMNSIVHGVVKSWT